MLTSLPLLLSVAALPARAEEAPAADFNRSVVVSPFKVFEPRLHAEYEDKLSDKTSYTVGVTYGKFNMLLLRLINAASESLGGEELVINNLGFNGAYNYYFKDFNRGWYTGIALEYDSFTASYGDESSAPADVLEIGPTIGWKIAGQGGFTFSWDWDWATLTCSARAQRPPELPSWAA